jgi:hypothetical protein
MIGILGNQHMRQQTRSRQAARDRPARRRCLHDPGYVVKTTAATDLPAALDAVLDGRQFVSGGLATHDSSAQAESVSSD